MEDLIDIRNRREQTNIVKWYNCKYDDKKNIIGEEGNDIYMPLSPEEKAEDSTTSYAEDILNKIAQARDDKVQEAIMKGQNL